MLIFRLFAVFGEKGLEHLKTPGINSPGFKGSSDCTMGLMVMLAVTKPALPTERPHLPEPVLNLLFR